MLSQPVSNTRLAPFSGPRPWRNLGPGRCHCLQKQRFTGDLSAVYPRFIRGDLGAPFLPWSDRGHPDPGPKNHATGIAATESDMYIYIYIHICIYTCLFIIVIIICISLFVIIIIVIIESSEPANEVRRRHLRESPDVRLRLSAPEY